ncbi:hypothetical protein TrLO_g13811 [Triparma laevis f. longispina]|uniref:E2 ubiquitin-conjugating enzyme n=1 Tax=Triparma laevis f. longispina TaxID=1714387 RepID=A0A9W7A8C6_9STRA|nr:hypothetical protein TrLO_g13811 [Triparma laevis f. longispina]
MSAQCENLPPQVVMRLAKEVRKLANEPPEGIKFLASEEENLGEVHAEIEGPVGTPYSGYFFELKLVLSGDFPNSPPRGFFLSKIYHPNVNPTSGDICVNTLKKDWSSTTTISHVLSVIRCLLIVPFPESSLNDEAGKLFMDSYEEYARRAKLMASVHARQSSSVTNPTSGDGKGEAPLSKSGSETTTTTASTTTITATTPTTTTTASKKKKSAGDDKKKAKKKNLNRL